MSAAAWQRASLTMLILDVLEVAPRHGYGILQAFVAAGLKPIKGGQLYPTLVSSCSRSPSSWSRFCASWWA